MSEGKLYVIKNDEGKYIAVTNGWMVDWHENSGDLFSSYQKASKLATTLGGHVVTLIEEPEKVILTKEQAEIVEDANKYKFPASYISMNTDDYDGLENLLMNAYVNGYTVAKEKKYLVYKNLGGKQKNKHEQVAQAYRSNLFFDTIIWLIKEHKIMSTTASDQFTEAEIEHYGLQDCEKEEVTDDEQ